MKYCTNCGGELRENDVFCTKCGQSAKQSEEKKNNQFFSAMESLEDGPTVHLERPRPEPIHTIPQWTHDPAPVAPKEVPVNPTPPVAKPPITKMRRISVWTRSEKS